MPKIAQINIHRIRKKKEKKQTTHTSHHEWQGGDLFLFAPSLTDTVEVSVFIYLFDNPREETARRHHTGILRRGVWW